MRDRDDTWGMPFAGEVAELHWLWQGYPAFGQTTLLTSPWTTGKTTLISLLLPRLKQGGHHLGGGTGFLAAGITVGCAATVHWLRSPQ